MTTFGIYLTASNKVFFFVNAVDLLKIIYKKESNADRRKS